MKLPLRRILRFGLLFVPVFIALAALYLVLVPYYQPLVSGASNSIMLKMTPASVLEQQHAKVWNAYLLQSEGGRTFIKKWHGFHWLYLNLVLLPALLLASPMPWRMRLRLSAISLVVLFGLHVISMTALVRAYVCLQQAPGTFRCLWTLRAVYTSGQLFAVALWGLFSWRYFFPRSGSPKTT